MGRVESWGVLGATFALVGSLLAWAVLTPGYRAPDEPLHTSTVLRLAAGGGYPSVPESHVRSEVPASFPYVGFPQPFSVIRLNGEGPPPSLADVALEELATRHADGETDFALGHPPGAYALIALAALVTDVEDRGPATALLLLRLLSAAFLLPIPWLLHRGARRIGLSPTSSVGVAFLPVAIPQVALIGATVSNGAALVAFSTAALVLLLGVATGDLRSRIALGVGLACSAALLSKGFAFALLPAVVLAYVLGARQRPRDAIKPLAVAAVATLPGIAWWILNLIRFGSVQPNWDAIMPSRATPVDPPNEPMTAMVRTFVDSLATTLLWNPNEFEAAPPAWVNRTALVVAVLILAAAWFTASRQAKAGIAIAAVPVAGVLVMLLVAAVGTWSHDGTVAAARARYLHLGLLALALALGVILDRRPGWTGHLAVPAAAAALGVAAISAGLAHWWEGDSLVERAAAVGAWWPAGSVLLISGVLLMIGGSIIAVGAIRRDALRA